MVDHSILLHKLNHYGVRGIINSWFSSYFSKRSQSTQIGSTVSDKEEISLWCSSRVCTWPPSLFDLC